MKNINDLIKNSLNEGILDDQETIIKRAEEEFSLKALLNAFDTNNNISGCDCLGNRLSPGDVVLYIPGKSHTLGRQTLQIGIVKKLTPKGVTIYTEPYDGGWKRIWWKQEREQLETISSSGQAVIKIDKNDVLK